MNERYVPQGDARFFGLLYTRFVKQGIRAALDGANGVPTGLPMAEYVDAHASIVALF